MNEAVDKHQILKILNDAGDKGITGRDLMSKCHLGEEAFLRQSESLWGKMQLTGIRDESCCGRGCGFICVSYMEMNKKWKLKSA